MQKISAVQDSGKAQVANLVEQTHSTLDQKNRRWLKDERVVHVTKDHITEQQRLATNQPSGAQKKETRYAPNNRQSDP